MQVAGSIFVIILAVIGFVGVILPITLIVSVAFAGAAGIQAIAGVGRNTFSLGWDGHQESSERPMTVHMIPVLDRFYEPQPARILYPLDGGWFVIFYLSRHLWREVSNNALTWYDRAKEWYDFGRDADVLVESIFYNVMAVGSYVAAGAYYVVAGIFWLVIVVVATVSMLIWTVGILFLMAILGVVMLAYTNWYKLFHDCPKCHARIQIPIYECPNCYREHNELLPSIYGVFRHTCECGEKLATSHLWGRSEYTQICPECKHVIHGYGSTVHLPVFGGASAGKSHFITVSIRQLLETTQSDRTVSIHFPDKIEEADYLARLERLDNDQTLFKTHKNEYDSVDGYNLQLNVTGRREPGLLYFYDMMGEHASRVDDSLNQSFLRFREGGVILVIDPFSFHQLQNEYDRDETREAYQVLRPSETPPEVIVNNLIASLEILRGKGFRQVFKSPLAVVVTKVDGLDLQDRIDAIAQMSTLPTDLAKKEQTISSRRVQKFLYTLDPNMVRLLHNNFPRIRYFAVSAMDNDIDGDDPVLPLRWMLEQVGLRKMTV